MIVNVYGKDIRLSDALVGFARTQFLHALGRIATRVRNIDVWVSDENGHRGGIDKVCHAEVRLAGAPQPVHVHAVHSDPYDAIHDAALKAKRNAFREIHRRRGR